MPARVTWINERFYEHLYLVYVYKSLSLNGSMCKRNRCRLVYLGHTRGLYIDLYLVYVHNALTINGFH